MNELERYLPILIPIFVLEITLLITALIHILNHDNYRNGNRMMWVLIVVFINIIGPILYLIFGRSDQE